MVLQVDLLVMAAQSFLAWAISAITIGLDVPVIPVSTGAASIVASVDPVVVAALVPDDGLTVFFKSANSFSTTIKRNCKSLICDCTSLVVAVVAAVDVGARAAAAVGRIETANAE